VGLGGELCAAHRRQRLRARGQDRLPRHGRDPGLGSVIGAPADRLELAKAWGADVTIGIEDHPDRADRLAIIRELTGDGASVVFELSGGRNAVGEGLEMVARGGRYVIVGTIGGEPQPILGHLITNRGLNVMGSMGGEIDSYYKALEFMRATRHEYDWNAMLGERYGLHEVTTALERQRSLAEIKPIIAPAKRED
jgi:threonine dehydrogenase-like Zn-dependent dehydrogenase